MSIAEIQREYKNQGLVVLAADWRGKDGLLWRIENNLYDLRARRFQYFTPPPTAFSAKIRSFISASPDRGVTPPNARAEPTSFPL